MREQVAAAFLRPLKTALDDLQDLLQAQPVTLVDVPRDIDELWRTADGRARVEVLPKGDPNDNETLRKFARAVLAVEPDATGGPISILESGDTIVRAFFEAGAWALISIAILLWIVLRRFGDVLLTIVPLLLAGVVTLELCVVLGMPLNFANIIALPLLLGIGVAFKIYYIMAWRAGQTGLLQSSLTRAVFYQRADDRDGVRQPVALEPSRHVEHGQAARAVAAHDARRGGAVPAGADGQAAPDRRIRDRELLLCRSSRLAPRQPAPRPRAGRCRSPQAARRPSLRPSWPAGPSSAKQARRLDRRQRRGIRRRRLHPRPLLRQAQAAIRGSPRGRACSHPPG